MQLVDPSTSDHRLQARHSQDQESRENNFGVPWSNLYCTYLVLHLNYCVYIIPPKTIHSVFIASHGKGVDEEDEEGEASTTDKDRSHSPTSAEIDLLV